MTLTLLLDLDDTLLITNQEAFLPAYLQAVSTHFAPRHDPRLVVRALLSGMNAMNDSEDSARPLSEVFDDIFYPQLEIPKGALDTEIENFYENTFPTLQGITAQNPHARPFVNWARSQGYRLVVATNPLLPRKAAYERIRWAGFDPHEFDLITAFDDFHFSKSYPAYYAEALGLLGWQEGPVLMAGNDLERDILPAKRLGLATFFVDEGPGSKSAPEAGLRGSLSDLRRYLESADPAALIPSFKTRESVIAIHASAPAVLNGLLGKLNEELWDRKPLPGEWSLTELVCHLRDTEREIHHMQLGLFNDHGEPFIPRPDTGVWASQRDYLHEDGAAALREFNEARRVTMGILKDASLETWERKARHAIFGPTNFREVAAFMADHDRMHIHQAWSLLRRL